MLVTHQTQWLHACDRILVMRHGAIVADGAWAELAADPSLPELQQAAGEATLADADVDAIGAGQPVSVSSTEQGEALSSGAQDAQVSANGAAGDRRRVGVRGAAAQPLVAEADTGAREACGSASAGNTGTGAASDAAATSDLAAANESAPAAASTAAPDTVKAEAAPERIRGSDAHDGAPASPVNEGKAAASDASDDGDGSLAKLPVGLTSAEHRERGSVSSGVYGRYICAVGVVSSAAVALALALGQSAWILSEWWLAEWSNESDAAQEDSKWLIVYGALVASAARSARN